jgi:hypothetical protein
MFDTAVVVTSYCGEPSSDAKRNMTKILCKNLRNFPFYICLSSHSTIDIETQNYCDMFIYDKDNRFSFDGVPSRQNNHGVAELTSVNNAVSQLKRLGIKDFLKVSYDNQPDLDYLGLIEKCKEIGKKAVTGPWGSPYSLGTHMYFCETDFFLETLSLEELYRCEKDLEYVWYESVRDKGLLEHVHITNDYQDFLGYKITQYCHNAGRKVDNYNFQ